MEDELFGYEREEDINAGSDDELFIAWVNVTYGD